MKLIKQKASIMISQFGDITGLFPSSCSAYEEYKKIELEKEYDYKYCKPRNKKHNDKYWSILQNIIDHYPTDYSNVESLHIAIKYELGYVKTIKKLNGEEIIIPESCNFERMKDQKIFDAFYNAALDLLSKIYNIKREEIEHDGFSKM
jgi:hypothetical protein